MQILESGDFWLVTNRLDTEPYGTAPLLGGVVELGITRNRIYMRKLWLPKAKYDRQSVELMLHALERCSVCREGLVLKDEKIISRLIPTRIRENMDKFGLVVGAFGGKALKEVMDRYVSPKIGATGNEAAKALLGAGLIALPLGFRMSPSIEMGVLGLGAFLLADGAGNIIKNVITGTPMTRVQLVPVTSSETYAPAHAPIGQGFRSLFG